MSATTGVIALVHWQHSSRVHFLFMTATVRRMPNLVGNRATSLTTYVSDMPVTLLEIKTAFGPEDTAAMTTAFDEALRRLNVADRKTPTATSVAKRIVRLAKRGERNPARLTDGVISSFRTNPIPMEPL